VRVGLYGRVAVTEIGILFRTEEHMSVDVDETRDDEQARGVCDTSRRRRGDVGGDTGDFPAGDRHVHDRVNRVLRIDHVPVPDQQIELRVLGLQGGDGNGHRNEHGT
jgi:hypothetical protein